MIETTVHADGLWVIALDRPDKRNAMTPDMFTELQHAVDDAAAECSSLVLAGNGPVFCGGFDLKLCVEQPRTLRSLLNSLAAQMTRLREFDFPVVIAAHGAAIAGGCALLGAADAVITNHDARIGYPVVKLGVSPAVSAPFLRRMVGDGRCRERQLDIDLVNGAEAARIGLASESLPASDDVLPRALAVARSLASKPAPAFAATKQWLREIADHDAQHRGYADASDEADRALRASLSVEGRDEERDRLAAMFTKPAPPSPKGTP